MSEKPSHQKVDASAASKQLKPYSCLTCRQRKVKCNRQSPCDNCVKAGSQCSFVPPVRGRRKRTKPVHEGMHAKLQRYEEMLKRYGANLDPENDESVNAATPSTSVTTNPSPSYTEDARQTASARPGKPKLVTKGDTSRYFENSIWSNAGDEFHHPDEYDVSENGGDSDEQQDELIFGSVDEDHLFGNSPPSRLTEFYPSLLSLQRLKDVFVDRIDPLMKILHFPTFWADTIKAVQSQQKVPRSLEAAIFCFYLASVSVLDDSQCRNLLGEPKDDVSGRSKRLARQALVNAGFLHTSNPLTLTAFILFLTSLRGDLRHDTQYVLCGIALRLAFKMGLHRDGEALGLPPFETEMRRRVWWQTAHMDFRVADMLGMPPSRDVSLGDAKPPLNLEDEDLCPGMTEFPPERKGITTISSCTARCEILHFLGKIVPSSSYNASWGALSNDDVPRSKKDALIDEMEDFFERKYLRYCDPTNPLDIISSIMMRSSVCKMRLYAHNPKDFATRKDGVSQAERDIVFSNAVKIIQYASSANNNPALQKYQWRVGTGYLWDMLLYVLIEVKRRRTGTEVDRLWPLLGMVIRSDSDIYKEKPSPVNAALRKWTLEAWDCYAAAMKADVYLEPDVPEYIEKMRVAVSSATMASGLRSAARTPGSQDVPASTMVDQGQLAQGDLPPGTDAFDGYNIPDLTSFDMDPNEWLNWEQLLSGTGALGKVNAYWNSDSSPP